MAARKFSPNSTLLAPSLSLLVNGRRPLDDAPHAALIHRVAARHLPADRNRIFEIYAPWVAIVASRLKNRRPMFYVNDLEDMIADGCVGLLKQIDQYRLEHGVFYWRARSGIAKGIYLGQNRMNFGKARADRNQGIIAGVRAELIAEHGHTPLADQVEEKLAGIITNPAFYVGRRAAVSSLTNEEGSQIQPADRRGEAPDQRAMDREGMKLAIRGMRPDDRKIFKLLLKGFSDVEIANKLGVTRQRIGQRLNGVLWEARSRADLAAYFGVEAEQPPSGSNKQNRPSPAKFPPARLAVSA